MTRSALLLLSCATLVACGDDSATAPPDAESLSIFNQTLDSWVPLDLGLEPGSTFEVTATQFGAQFDFDAAAAGGEGVIAREYVVSAGVEYVVSLDLTVESSDGTADIDPWTIVVGTSVEGAPFQFIDAFSTATTSGANPQALPIFGDVPVTSGAPANAGDTESEVRVAIGFRPESADTRTYRLQDARVRFTRASGR